MKLSMAIIEHWLRRYHPVSTISSDEPGISGIRLFSYEKTPDPQYLYVGRNRDFFENSQSDEVLLVHQKDVISLNTQELEDVFDSLMDAYVFYENWEQNMLSAFQQKNPEQIIIDSCKDIFGPMFFTTMSLQVTAFSRQYPVGSINRNWDDFWERGALSLSSLSRMQSGRYLKYLNHKWDCKCFYEEQVEKYPYSMMISQENSAQKLTGQLTIIGAEPFQTYHRHLAIFLKRALCMVANHEETADCGTVAQSLLLDFIQGEKNDHESCNTFYQMMGWKPEQACVIVILKHRTIAPITYAYHLKYLRRCFPNVLFCTSSTMPEHMDEEIVCCIPLETLKKKDANNRFGLEYPDIFFETAKRQGLVHYVSYPFPGIQNAAGQYAQAKTCLKHGKTSYYDCALQDLADLSSSSECRRLAIHPAIRRILQYDREKKTSFYHMLCTYLRCERNRVLTSEKLFLHKNTLVYRIEKTEKLFCLDLDDPYEREYLLLSFRCLESLM